MSPEEVSDQECGCIGRKRIGGEERRAQSGSTQGHWIGRPVVPTSFDTRRNLALVRASLFPSVPGSGKDEKGRHTKIIRARNLIREALQHVVARRSKFDVRTLIETLLRRDCSPPEKA